MNLSVTMSAIALVAGALSPVSLGAPVTLNSPATLSTPAPGTLSASAPRDAAEIHCVGEALPVGTAAEEAAAALEPVCFDTREEASAYLERLTQSTSRSATAASSVVLGTVYSDANYGGSTYTLFGSGTCSGVTFGFPSLSGGWDSSISSAKAASGCWVTLYKATSYGGEKITCMPGCPTLSTLNDQVRSIVFRPQGTVG